MTRTGVLKYRDKDGKIRRELRPPEEVFDPDSLASLEDAPITNMHPKEMVTSENFSSYSKGHVKTARADDAQSHVVGKMIVMKRDMVDRIMNEDARELSPGYTVTLDHTPGVYKGEKYDAIQRNIRYNHIGIGPSGWGRSGPSVALRLDSSDDVASEYIESTELLVDPKENTDMTVKIRLDDKSFEVAEGSASDLEALISTKEKALEESKLELTKAEARLDALENQVKELEVEKKDMFTQTDLDEHIAEDRKIQERSKQIREYSSAVLGYEVKFDGKSNRDLMTECLKASSVKDVDMADWSDEKIGARFDAVMEIEVDRKKKSDDSLKKTLGVVPEGETRTDAATAYEKMVEELANAGTQPIEA